MEFHSKQVGERLKQARKQRKASQSDIAEAIGVGVSAFSSYETGVSSPTAENLVKISILLGISIDWLLLGEGPMEKGSAVSLPSSSDGLEATVRFQAETIARLTRMLEERK